jgi:hypothetical protein
MLYKNHAKWAELYDKLKGPDWPQTAPPEVDYTKLPQWVQDELHQFGYRPQENSLKRFITTGRHGINVFHLKGQDGGGTGHGQDYISVIDKKYPNRVFHKAYEWCSGPGFIAYSLLDHGICKNICLSDIHDPALLCAEETMMYTFNQVKDNVSIYLLKDLALLPKHEMFDLVVANPPHASVYEVENLLHDNRNRITSDINWEAHQNFFANIKNNLTDDGIILLQENHAGSTLEDFLPFIKNSGLKVTDHFLSTDWYESDKDHTDPSTWPVHKIYYIELQHNK